MHIGILTGGGDVPGLNSTIYRLVTGACARGHRVTGFRRGWQGVVALDPRDPRSVAEHTVALDARGVEDISQRGGTILRSSRTNPGRMPGSDPSGASVRVDATPTVLRTLAALQLDVLVAIGGDDTLGYAQRLGAQGFAVIGIPKTMDNDVGGTDVCLGFPTCVSRSVQYLHQLRTSSASHERFLVVEVMGRNNGSSCLLPAWLADADRALIAEVPFDINLLCDKLSADRARRDARYAMVVVSEGAAVRGGHVIESGPEDAYGHRKLGGIGAVVASELKARTGVGIIEQKLGYLVRSGPPDALDVALTYAFASLALELIDAGTFGRLVAVRQGRYTHVPLTEAATPSQVALAQMYDAAEMRPQLRGVAGLGLFGLAASPAVPSAAAVR